MNKQEALENLNANRKPGVTGSFFFALRFLGLSIASAVWAAFWVVAIYFGTGSKIFAISAGSSIFVANIFIFFVFMRDS